MGLDPSTEVIRDVLTEIGWAKSSLLTPDTYADQALALGRDLPAPAPEVARAFRAYEDLKVSGPVRMLDFDDLLGHMADLVEEVPAIAEEFRDRYRCFVVDEFQDVTPAQQRLLGAWMGNRDDLTVVGDVNQTIYSFAGAEPDFLLGFADKYPGATVVRLESDYRSTPQVVELANAVIGAGAGRFRSAGLTLKGMRPPGPDPTLEEYADEDAEAEAVAGAIADLVHGGLDPAEIAVLYRVNAQSERIEAALEQVGIGYRLKGGEGFFERPVIRRAMSTIDRLVDGSDESVAQANAQLADPTEVVAAIRGALEPLGLTAAEPSGAQARETWNSLTALVGLAEELANAETRPGLLPVVAGLRERAAARHAPDERGVTLASFHAAKGLEWDAVFLIGVHEGSLPISHAINAGPAGERPGDRADSSTRCGRPLFRRRRVAPPTPRTRDSAGVVGRNCPAPCTGHWGCAPNARWRSTPACSSACGTGAGRPRSGSVNPPTPCSPTTRWRRSPGNARPTPARSAGSAGSGPTNWGSTATTCCGSSAKADPAPAPDRPPTGSGPGPGSGQASSAKISGIQRRTIS